VCSSDLGPAEVICVDNNQTLITPDWPFV